MISNILIVLKKSVATITFFGIYFDSTLYVAETQNNHFKYSSLVKINWLNNN